MKKTEGNRMTVDQENRIIRKCNHVKSIGAMAVYPILGRIPPLLSEVKVGDECRLFFY